LSKLLKSAPQWIGAPALNTPATGTIEDAREGTVTFINEWKVATIEFWKKKSEFDDAD